MPVNPSWLQSVREKNRAKFGMAGMGGGVSGLGDHSAQALVDALNASRDQRSVALKKAEPQKEYEQGSVESILQSLPELQVQPTPEIPRGVLYVGGAIAVGLTLLIGISLFRGGSE